MEIQLYAEHEFPFTAEWYTTREHAPHLEQPVHRPRMEAVAGAVRDLIVRFGEGSVVDLGAGDGGMLSLIKEATYGTCQLWGYDLMSTNTDYAREVRGQDVRFKDFVDEPIEWADVVVITECLEHLENPHGMVQRIGENAKAIVASSPAKENAESHDACHAWIWDMEGYRALIEQGGFTVVDHFEVGGGYDFQVIVGIRS